MPFYVGLDASKLSTSICVIDGQGVVAEKGSVPTDPDEIVRFLRGQRRRYKRVGMEAFSLAPWLYVGLAKAGLPVICIDAQHAHGILKAMRVNKTDKNDAQGIAEIMMTGVYRAVHIKSHESRVIGVMLTLRKAVLCKVVDAENAIRSILLEFGLKLKAGPRRHFGERVRLVTGGHEFLLDAIAPLLTIHACACGELAGCDLRLEHLAFADPVCRRLMSAPGVGPVTALAFRAAVDEPKRFSHSRSVGAYFGLTARTSQSGELNSHGRITKRGDRVVRSLLFTAALYQVRPNARASWLKEWGDPIVLRRGTSKGVVAIARRLAVTLHQMWISETDFRWLAPP